MACFHPRHAFHGLDDDDVLNYEKRSPHPTINLLRFAFSGGRGQVLVVARESANSRDAQEREHSVRVCMIAAVCVLGKEQGCMCGPKLKTNYNVKIRGLGQSMRQNISVLTCALPPSPRGDSIDGFKAALCCVSKI